MCGSGRDGGGWWSERVARSSGLKRVKLSSLIILRDGVMHYSCDPSLSHRQPFYTVLRLMNLTTRAAPSVTPQTRGTEGNETKKVRENIQRRSAWDTRSFRRHSRGTVSLQYWVRLEWKSKPTGWCQRVLFTVPLGDVSFSAGRRRDAETH